MKSDTYEKVYHCKDCEFMWALGCDRNVCTIDIISKLPRHPHDAIDFKSNDEIYEYDSVVRDATNDDDVVDFYSGTCDAITLRLSSTIDQKYK